MKIFPNVEIDTWVVPNPGLHEKHILVKTLLRVKHQDTDEWWLIPFKDTRIMVSYNDEDENKGFSEKKLLDNVSMMISNAYIANKYYLLNNDNMHLFPNIEKDKNQASEEEILKLKK